LVVLSSVNSPFPLFYSSCPSTPPFLREPLFLFIRSDLISPLAKLAVYFSPLFFFCGFCFFRLVGVRVLGLLSPAIPWFLFFFCAPLVDVPSFLKKKHFFSLVVGSKPPFLDSPSFFLPTHLAGGPPPLYFRVPGMFPFGLALVRFVANPQFPLFFRLLWIPALILFPLFPLVPHSFFFFVSLQMGFFCVVPSFGFGFFFFGSSVGVTLFLSGLVVFPPPPHINLFILFVDLLWGCVSPLNYIFFAILTFFLVLVQVDLPPPTSRDKNF